MKTFVITLATALILSTSVTAETPDCSRKDVVIGVVGGVVVATGAALSAVSGLRVVGAGVAAGTRLGVRKALSSPYLRGTTLPMVAGTNAILAPIYATAIYYGSCAMDTLIK